jgi:hypothetical protein
MSRGLTENGEHGAAATRTMAPGDGSWNRRTASSVAVLGAALVVSRAVHGRDRAVLDHDGFAADQLPR